MPASSALPPWDPRDPLLRLSFGSFSARGSDGIEWKTLTTSFTELRLSDLVTNPKFVIGLIASSGQRANVDFQLGVDAIKLFQHLHAKAVARLSLRSSGSVVAWDSFTNHIPFARPAQNGPVITGSVGLSYSIAAVTDELAGQLDPSIPPVRLTISNLSLAPTLVDAVTGQPLAVSNLTNASLPNIEMPKEIYDDNADWHHTVYTQPDFSKVTYTIQDPLPIKVLFPQNVDNAQGRFGGFGNLHDVATIAQSAAVIVSVLALNGLGVTELPPQPNVSFHVDLALTGHRYIP